jgi:peroxiredoxin
MFMAFADDRPFELLWALLLSLVIGVGAACHRPLASAAPDPGPTRLAILDPNYGADPDHTHAIAPGDTLEALSLPLADGGRFELADAAAAGPVLLVWIGGAEHEGLTSWARGLDRELAQLEARAATLVFVRPLEPEPALRWATEIPLQAAVAGDPDGELAQILDLISAPDQPAPALDFAVIVLTPATQVAYRKLGGRRPALAELLAVLDGEAQTLRCCPGACVGEPCE